jgi:mono/diheme cytochrome c family protein
MRVRATGTMMTMAFLLSLAASPAFAADVARGQELSKSLGCKGCHKIEGSGGNLGPALDGVGKRMKAEQLRKQLVEPKSLNPKSIMPAQTKLPAADLQALIDYMQSLK